MGILTFAVLAEVPLLFALSYSSISDNHPLQAFIVLTGLASLPIGFAMAIPATAFLQKKAIQFDHTPYTIIAIAGTASTLAAIPGDHGSVIALLLGFIVQCLSALWACIAGIKLNRRFEQHSPGEDVRR